MLRAAGAKVAEIVLVTLLQTGLLRICDLIRNEGKVSSLQSAQTSSGAHPSSCAINIRASFPIDKVAML